MNQVLGNKLLYIELIGPAGAGKTTLVRSLIRSGKNITIAPKPSIRSIGNIIFYTKNFFDLWPIFSKQRFGERWLTMRELWWMLFLNGWTDVLEHRSSTAPQLGVELIDHGPIYMLTSLYAFGPAVTQTTEFRHWWHKMLVKWMSLLDSVIWLDASNATLAARINARGSEHPVKGKTEENIHLFLDQYRGAFQQVFSMLAIPAGRNFVLQFDTDRETPDQIKERILELRRSQV